jgi:hypothetical protein
MKATPPKTTRQTFHFNTGVRPYAHIPPVPIMPGNVVRDGTLQIPFDCEVPENAFFKFACDNPEGRQWAFLSGALASKYAFFSLPVS